MVSTHRTTAGKSEGSMEAGKVWGLVFPGLKAGSFRRRLFLKDHRCVMRPGHRLHRRRQCWRRSFPVQSILSSFRQRCQLTNVSWLSPGACHSLHGRYLP